MRTTTEETRESNNLVLARFLSWLHNEMHTPQRVTRRESIWGYIGFISGIIGAVWTIPLAYRFGAILIAKDLINISSHIVVLVIGVIFALFSFPASAILFGRTTNFVLMQLISTRKSHADYFLKDKSFVKKYTPIVCVWAAAMINAIPPGYLTFVFLRSYLGGWSLVPEVNII